MLPKERKILPADPGTPQPITWVDCHIPHVDTLHTMTRSQAGRRSSEAPAEGSSSAGWMTTPLPPKGNHPGPPTTANSAVSVITSPLTPPIAPISLLFASPSTTPLPPKGNHPHSAIPAPPPPTDTAGPAKQRTSGERM